MRTCLIVSLFLSLSCRAQISESPPPIVVGGKAFVRVNATHVQDSVHILSSYWPLLSEVYEFFTDEYRISADSSLLLTFQVSIPSKHTIHLGKKLSVPVFLAPGDTLTLNVDYQSGQNSPNISFLGNYANITRYLVEKPGHIAFSGLGARVFNDPFYSETPEKTVLLYRHISDSVADRQLAYLKEMQTQYHLPDWFTEHEKNEVLLFAAYHQMILPKYWETMLKVDLSVPKDYHQSIRKINCNTPYALYSPLFAVYVGNALMDSLQIDQKQQALLDSLGKETPDEINGTQAYEHYMISSFQRVGDEAEKLLDDKIFYVFLTQEFFISARRESRSISQKYLAYVSEKLKNTAYLAFLLEQYEKFAYRITAGDKAPTFYLLSDQKEQYLSLSDFKGRLLLLNFWFPGCKPCIAEIPHEKELLKKYGEKGFIIVNICLEATIEQWQDAIARFDLAGVNMVAQGNWERKLKETYSVGGFPHYVLIDQQGNIIENQTYSPSDPRLIELIETSLPD